MLVFKIWLAVLLSSVLPFLAIPWLWKSKTKNKLDWALTVSIVGALSVLAFIATPWAMTSYYLRYVLIVLFALAVYFSFRKFKEGHLENPSSTSNKLAIAVKAILLLALLPLDIMAISTYFYPAQSVELFFPLSDGVYYVIQGGNNVITSPFHRTGTDNREDYAIDIVKLNWAGNRATGVLPQELSSYAIYGETVHSPCSGEVIEVVDGLPENPIGTMGGISNRIVIRCKGVRVSLAHMKSGSLLIQQGQLIEEGQPIGIVGNAGQTSEPHLHIHAVRDLTDNSLEPMPISFDGKVLSLNSVIMR
jgi:murein DD-endopeptidase MepM/ murein hydrolase activator NlpD/branched-subunit amino acid transport protein AzlD